MEHNQDEMARHLTALEEKVKGERQVHGLSGEVMEIEDIDDAVMDYRLDFGESKGELEEIYATLMATEHELTTLEQQIP
jgi:hypothetical protein